MKNIVLIALMLFGMTLPANARVEMTGDSPSVLFWLDFHVNNESDDDDDFSPISSFDIVAGRLYSDGQMELTFDNNEAVIVSINLNDLSFASVPMM